MNNFAAPAVQSHWMVKANVKKFSFLLIQILISASLLAQIGISKIIGKNSSNAKLGYTVFANIMIPLNEAGNRSLALELMDFSYYPQKNTSINSSTGYISIKAGYKYFFSDEGSTGFYIEPSAGFCRVVNSDDASDNATHGDGVAAATEVGYTIGVGRQDNNINFCLKYERDMAGRPHTISTIGFRISYSFHLFARRG